MKIHSIPVVDIQISPNRQRKEFNSEKLQELAASIDQNGLIHPIVVRKENGQTFLVAGERRLRSLEYVWNFGGTVRCGTQKFEEGQAPCLWLGEIDPIEAFEIELEENIRREDLSWQDRATATSQLMELRRLQAEKDDRPEPTVRSIAQEIVPEGGSINTAHTKVKRDLILARHLDDPDVQRAKTADEGYKILVRKEINRQNAQRGAEVQADTSGKYRLVPGDCIVEMAKLASSSFDVILTDPPYGINAQDYGDSGGKTAGAHLYDDSPEEWQRLMSVCSMEFYRLAKPNAHAYIFCDIDMFHSLKLYMQSSGWNVFRTPLVWINPQGMRAPWPDCGPQRKYQLILFAMKGKKNVSNLAPDVITCGPDTNLGHQAQKPVGLYTELLKRSSRPGESILDPFCGTGVLFPACATLHLYATGIECESYAVGIARSRIAELV